MSLRETFFTYLAIGVGTYAITFLAYQTRMAARMLVPMIKKDEAE